jgi:hypothetical protein
LTSDWGEGEVFVEDEIGMGAPAAMGDATWRSNFHGVSEWSTVGGGGDFIPSASASQFIGEFDQIDPLENLQVFSGPLLAEDVRGWLASPEENFGWILVGRENAIRTARRFNSSETLSGQAPRLVINGEMPSEGIANGLSLR